jgi:Polyketide cyclase / dehydrase and lipid transport
VQTNSELLWHEIGSFQSVGAWHPMLANVEGHGEQPGSLRTATGKDGSKQVERLEELDRARRFYRSTMLSSAMPVCDYTAELRVRDEGKNTSTVLWSRDFRVTAGYEEETADLVRQFFTAGLDHVRQKYE